MQHSNWFKSNELTEDSGNSTRHLPAVVIPSTETGEGDEHCEDSNQNNSCELDIGVIEHQVGRIKFQKNENDIKEHDIEIYIAELLLRHIQQLVCNAHAITKLQVSHDSNQTLVDSQSQVRVATAIYPTASLMNHSCDPTIISR